MCGCPPARARARDNAANRTEDLLSLVSREPLSRSDALCDQTYGTLICLIRTTSIATRTERTPCRHARSPCEIRRSTRPPRSGRSTDRSTDRRIGAGRSRLRLRGRQAGSTCFPGAGSGKRRLGSALLPAGRCDHHVPAPRYAPILRAVQGRFCLASCPTSPDVSFLLTRSGHARAHAAGYGGNPRRAQIRTGARTPTMTCSARTIPGPVDEE
jgi:hypothetical protein